MNILYVINSADHGGSERHLLDLASGMVKKGNNVWIFSPSGPMIDEYKKRGIHCKEIYPKKDIDFKYIFQVKKFLESQNIDVLHTHLLKTTVNGLLAGYLAKTKMKVAHIHGSLISWEVPWYKKYSNVFINSLIQNVCADKVVALTQAVKTELVEKEKIREDKIVIIPNGIDIKRYERKGENRYFHEKYNWSSKIQVIGTIGRLTIERGQKYFIEAAKYIVANCTDVKFVIIGEGVLKQEYLNLVSKLGLEEYVFFEGYIKEDVKQQILQSIDIYVSPAIREGFGLALVEAMASSLPIVATNLDVTQEVCPSDECALLVSPTNSKELGEKIVLILEDKEKQAFLAKNACLRAKDKYSLEVFINNYDNLYIEFLKKK